MPSPDAHRVAAIAACALAIVVAGCGGGGSRSGPGSATGSAPPAAGALKNAPGRVTRLAGLLGGAGSAGSARSYVPSGQIVADSGFRPQVDGFDFENYGNDAGPVNMTPANVVDLFGNQVCLSGSGASCRLGPSARHWMDQVNVSMAAGHCMGFSVSALRFFTHDLSPASFGAPHTFNLPVQGNAKLQSLIAENFAYQDLPAVTSHAVQGTPTQVVNALVRALKAHRETYTLAILKADGTGGHAITPIAVEDRGHGQASIIVYDNNFPGILRAVQVDTNADTWHYVGGINPTDTGEIYEGNATTRSMLLLPTSAGEKTQPCPFCAPSGKGPGAKPSVIDKLHYIEVGITAKEPQHPHLLFTDDQGRRTGFDHGKLVAQIPGIQVIQNFSVQNWSSAPEPTYHLPLGHPGYQVTVEGSNVTKPIKTQLQVNGSGLVFYVQDIHMAPGQMDTMVLPHGDLAISYATASHFPASPAIGVQFPEIDFHTSRPGQPKLRLITMATGSIGFAPNSPVGLLVNPPSGQAAVSSVGDQPLVPSARFVLSVDSSPLNGGTPEHFYLTGSLPLPANAAARYEFLNPTTPTLPVDIIGAGGKSIGRVQVPPHP
ncbi:MAG: hypothetical protein M3Z06_11640 [Actinomycetota bacterium]|nr:hypothetical protein [Actinomycetota bacterium]